MSYNTETVSRPANTLTNGQTNGFGVRVMPTKARALVERMPASYDPAPSYRAINKRDIHARKRWGDE